MAAYVLSPERWKELSSSTTSSPTAAGQVAEGQQTPTGGGGGQQQGVLRRRISRVFYESHTPVSSPVVLNLHHHQDSPEGDAEDLAAAGVVAILAERFLPQRRSPGQRSQDSGFSGYSGDSASEGSSSSPGSNNSPVPALNAGGKRSPLVDPEAAERALAADSPDEQPAPLETDLDAAATNASISPSKIQHISRIYIGNQQNPEQVPVGPSGGNLHLRDVLCEKNIQPVNLSNGSASGSPDKCVGDKNLISAVLASSGRNNHNCSGSEAADRSADSQTALLLENKSIPTAGALSSSATASAVAGLRPNLSWKKLSESFRRVISSSRMMTTGSSSPPMSCLPAVTASEEPEDGCQDENEGAGLLADESFTDEEKSRMLLMAKRSNIRRMHQHLLLANPTDAGYPQRNHQSAQEEDTNCVQRAPRMTESPQPTSRYLGGPRSSTPRKSTTTSVSGGIAGPQGTVRHQIHNNNNNNNHVNHMNKNNTNNELPRRCSRSDVLGAAGSRAAHRVHWADRPAGQEVEDDTVQQRDLLQDQEEAAGQGRKLPNRCNTGGPTHSSSCWPENSTWDSDTPSLEIGQQQQLNQWHGNDYPALPAPSAISDGQCTAPALTLPEPKRIRRGLRMGTQSPHVRLRQTSLVVHQQSAPAPPVQLLVLPPPPVIIPPLPTATSSSTTVESRQPFGLRWSPVEAWLKDLPMFYQPESTCALQNKAIQPQEDPTGSWVDESSFLTSPIPRPAEGEQQPEGDRTYSATVTARAQVRRLQRRAHLISTEFAQLCSFIELFEESKLSSLIPLFLAHVIQFIREAEQAALQTDPSDSEDLINSLRQTCSQLVQLVTFSPQQHHYPGVLPTLSEVNGGQPTPSVPVNWSLARQVTARLGQVFVSIVDTFVGREIQVLTAALQNGNCVSAARLAANSLMSLGADAARPALGPLINAFRQPRLRPVQADLLRALSALCSSADIIQDFEQLGGLSVISQVLCNPRSGSNLEERSEAAGLLAQITSPWLDPPADVDPKQQQQALMEGGGEEEEGPIIHSWPSLHLTPFISPFIAALTELSAETETEETLLLSTAALANLTFSHSEAVQLMTKYRTAQVLVQASGQRTKDLSVFIKDQIATILANMAAAYSSRKDLVTGGALATLLCFLEHSKPCPSQRPAEVTASERVLKKSAIALSRICGEEDAARQIVELGGIERLSQLVRDPRERNYSDGVLVACLAALHKIATACGAQHNQDELERRGASDLIENRLLDVFLRYSSRPESYV